MGLVVIGILDTDCDPSHVDIVIPGNDDALKSVRLLVDQLVSAVEEGSANHRERMASMGVAEKHQDDAFPSDGPMPTRGNVMPRPRASEADGAPRPDAARGADNDDAQAVRVPDEGESDSQVESAG